MKTRLGILLRRFFLLVQGTLVEIKGNAQGPNETFSSWMILFLARFSSASFNGLAEECVNIHPLQSVALKEM